jgi:hypothetical protein
MMQSFMYFFSNRVALSIISAGASASTCCCIISASIKSFEDKSPESIKKFVRTSLQNSKLLHQTVCEGAEISVSAAAAWPFDAKARELS